MAEERAVRDAKINGFVIGGLVFLFGSYVAHCKFNLGPWGCQKSDGRRKDCRRA